MRNGIVWLGLGMVVCMPVSAEEEPWRESLEQTEQKLRVSLEQADGQRQEALAEYERAHGLYVASIRMLQRSPSALMRSAMEKASRADAEARAKLTQAAIRHSAATRAWQNWTAMPEDSRQFLRLERALHRYVEGEGTREVMVGRYRKFAQDYPDSPKAPEALFRAASLYTQWTERKSGKQPRNLEEARKIHARIVKTYPDLLSPHVVWSRQELACLHRTADQRLEGRLKLLEWLGGIKEEQYAETIREMRRQQPAATEGDKELRDRIGALIAATRDSAETNIVYDARASSSPVANLRFLQAKFPGTSVGELASRVLSAYNVDVLAGVRLEDVLASSVGRLGEHRERAPAARKLKEAQATAAANGSGGWPALARAADPGPVSWQMILPALALAGLTVGIVLRVRVRRRLGRDT